MLPGEEKLGKAKKKASRPQWTHVKAITEDILRKMIEAENERREMQTEADRSVVKGSVLANSTLYKLFGHVKGAEFKIEYEPPAYKDVDVQVEMKIAEGVSDVISGELTEDVCVPGTVMKKSKRIANIPSDSTSVKEAAQTVAAYVIVDMEKDSNLDLISAVSARANEWVKSK